MEYNPGISLFFGLQNYKSCINKKNYEQKSNTTRFLRRSPIYIRSLPEMITKPFHNIDIFDP